MHLAKCITNVEELCLHRCDIGAIEVESLSQGIIQRDHPVITTLIYNCFVNIFILYVMKRRVRLFGLENVAQRIWCVFGLTASR